MDGSVNAATRAPVREAMNAPESPLNAFPTHLENDSESLLARSFNAVKGADSPGSGEESLVQPEYVIVRAPTIFESSKHALSLPARFLLRAAASSMADNWYFWSAVQIQQLLSSLTLGKMAENSIRQRIANCKTFFSYAEQEELIEANPFRTQVSSIQDNESGKLRIGADIIDKAIAAAPDAQWKLLIALWRFAGLRKMEPMHLQWDDVL